MSQTKTCKSCEYFSPNSEASPGALGGLCRRYPPVPMIMQQTANILGSGGLGMAGVSPPVDEDYSCGEWKNAKPLALAS